MFNIIRETNSFDFPGRKKCVNKSTQRRQIQPVIVISIPPPPLYNPTL